MTTHPPIGCSEYRQHLRLNRRGFLQAGMLGMAGLSLPQLLQMQAQAAQGGKTVDRTKSVIILWMRGGPASTTCGIPSRTRPPRFGGEFKTIATKVPGILIRACR